MAKLINIVNKQSVPSIETSMKSNLEVGRYHRGRYRLSQYRYDIDIFDPKYRRYRYPLLQLEVGSGGQLSLSVRPHNPAILRNRSLY